MICPNCKTENRENARYCDTCGYELPTVAYVAREVFGEAPHDLYGSAAETVDLAGLDQMTDSSFVPLEIAGDTIRLDEDSPSSAIPTAPLPAQNPYEIPAGQVWNDATVNLPALGGQYEVAMPSQTNRNFIAGSGGALPPQHPGYPEGPSSGASGSGSPKRKRGRIIAFSLIGLLIAIFALAALTYAGQLWGGKVVPDTLGMTENEAVATLQGAGFAPKVVKVKSDDVEGIVLASDPGCGQRAEAGSEVVIDVSIARLIPDIVGMSRDEAAALLTDEGFTNVEFTEKKSDEAQSTVLSVNPASGTRSKADTKIVVEIAEPYRVPEVTGLSLEEASAALEGEGYSMKVAYVYDEQAGEGTAVSTAPAAGEALPSGSEVTLNIAKHRSTELVALTRSFFTDSPKFTLSGQPYELREVKAVEYRGDGTCSFTIVARPYETHSWFGVQTETRYGNDETIRGTMTFADDNSVSHIDPAISRG